MVCTTPARCGAPALHTKGPRCIGRPDGKDDCDCLNACGDDPWIESGRSMPCDHRRETQARIAALTTAAPAAVAGPLNELEELNLLNKLIALGAKAAHEHAQSNSDDGHKGTAAYVQWQELRAEMGELIRNAYAAPTAQPAPQQEAQEPVMIYHGDCIIDCGEHGHHHVELLRMIPAGSKLYTAPQPSSAAQEGQ